MNNLLITSTKRMGPSWQPHPVQRPQVDPDFPHLNHLQRATESWRYVFLCWEHWVSPSGNFREWLRHNFRVAAYLLIPAVLFIPLLTYLLTAFTTWSDLLGQMVKNLLIPSVFLSVMVIIFLRILSRR